MNEARRAALSTARQSRQVNRQSRMPIKLSRAAKRGFDVATALLALLIFSPLFLGVALLVKASGPGPVFYRHTRIGRHGIRFGCLKFRTMVTNGDNVLAVSLREDPALAREWSSTRKLKNDPRVTPVGAVLRRYSVDELPQILNILKGDMSVVGPRPVTQDELAMYGAASDVYLSMRPGLTGLWQVSGRNDVTYATRVALDQYYARYGNFSMDTIIILRTVATILRPNGSY